MLPDGLAGTAGDCYFRLELSRFLRLPFLIVAVTEHYGVKEGEHISARHVVCSTLDSSNLWSLVRQTNPLTASFAYSCYEVAGDYQFEGLTLVGRASYLVI